MQLDKMREPEEANDIMLVLGQHKAELVALDPPARFSMTVADVAKHTGTSSHIDAVKAWAAAAWADWSQHHDYIIHWAESHMSR
jgi:hypothetical protein